MTKKTWIILGAVAGAGGLMLLVVCVGVSGLGLFFFGRAPKNTENAVLQDGKPETPQDEVLTLQRPIILKGIQVEVGHVMDLGGEISVGFKITNNTATEVAYYRSWFITKNVEVRDEFGNSYQTSTQTIRFTRAKRSGLTQGNHSLTELNLQGRKPPVRKLP